MRRQPGRTPNKDRLLHRGVEGPQRDRAWKRDWVGHFQLRADGHLPAAGAAGSVAGAGARDQGVSVRMLQKVAATANGARLRSDFMRASLTPRSGTIS